MKWIPIFSLFCLASISFFSCVDPPDYPDEPVIEFLSLSKSSIFQGGLDNDTLAVTFSFTDGDGDLSFPELSTEQDIIIGNSQDTVTFRPQIPPIPAQGAANGISGEITFFLFNSNFGICCTTEDYPLASPCIPTSFPSGATNTIYYTIQIRDRAGRYSNVIQTDDITIICRQ